MYYPDDIAEFKYVILITYFKVIYHPDDEAPPNNPDDIIKSASHPDD